MSHLYPLAKTADEALNASTLAARTRSDAESLAGGRAVLKLETEWVTPKSENVLAIMDAADAGPGQGFVQRYENETGAPVLAVTYWKISDDKAAPSASPNTEQKSPPELDHTDDLYFREGRTKPTRKRGKKKFVDPDQLDMFSEAKDPDS